MKNNDSGFNPIHLVYVFFGVLVLGFIFRQVAFIFFMGLMLAMFLGSIFFIVKHFRDAKKEEYFKSSMEGSIRQNLALCEEQIIKNNQEVLEIKDNIYDLKEKLEVKSMINENTIIESELLISGFERELDLRNAKLDFYKICKDKIQNIHFNQTLADDVAQKKERLKQLQEDHFEDLADMEKLRSDVNYTKTYIETISNLSIRMSQSTSLSTAQELHEELKLITKELRDL
ncbi:MAG: hypothetical protein AB8F94_27345 [Saprospiraceae bacterium]